MEQKFEGTQQTIALYKVIILLSDASYDFETNG
jgi:hypothetical protein